MPGYAFSEWDAHLSELKVLGKAAASEVFPEPLPQLDGAGTPLEVFWLEHPYAEMIAVVHTEEQLHVVQCMTGEEYWPSPMECIDEIPAWTKIMFGSLQENAEYADLSKHWREGSQRYGSKGTPLERFILALNLDPEQRVQRLGLRPPPHIAEAIRVIDRCVGIRAGVGVILESELVRV